MTKTGLIFFGIFILAVFGLMLWFLREEEKASPSPTPTISRSVTVIPLKPNIAP